MSISRVIIVGGGIIGASIAYHLSEAGIEGITLVEKEKMLGLGATQYCSGGIRTQFTTAVNVLFSKASIPELEKLSSVIDFKKYGYLILDVVADSAPRVKMQNDLGVPVEYLGRAGLKERFPYLNLDGVVSASFYDQDGIADPASLLEYYYSKAKAAGVEFLFEREVAGIRRDGKGIGGIRTDKEELEAEWVVLAAGIGSEKLGETIGLKIPFVKRRKYVAVVDGLPFVHPLIMEIPTGWYIKKEGENSLIGMSGKFETVDFEKKEEALEETFAATFHRIPQTENFSLKKVLTTISDETPDKHAIIDHSIQGLIIATGFSGHGFMHSPAVGKIVATLIKGEKPEIDISSLALSRHLIKETIAI